MNETLITSIITICLALLAGFVALTQVKSNIISSARVKWVEDLRNLISLYCSELENCSQLKLDFNDKVKNLNDENDQYIKENFYGPYARSANEVLKLQSKTLLYLNPDNSAHKEILELLRINSVLVHEKYADHRQVIQKNIERVISLAQRLFESEMKKARKLFTR